MPRENLWGRTLRRVLLVSSVLLAGVWAAQAQTPPAGTVIPRVCVDTPYQTGTVTLAANAAAGARTISVNGYVPPFVALIINPGGATQERVPYIARSLSGSNPYTLELKVSISGALSGSGTSYNLAFAHSAGETVSFAGYSGLAYFGYNNTSNDLVNIPKGVNSSNYFSPGPLVYSAQPTQFLPGLHDAVFALPFGGQAADTLTWFLNNGQVAAGNLGPGCGIITYQGRLADANTAANGLYDLQFTAYNALSGGTAQSGSIVVEDVLVVNGVFTVALNFGASFSNNDNARFLEIGVRAGTATGAFTTLAPRQPITQVPFAINAQNAEHATTAMTATTATNATNADKLGNVAANQYVVTTDPRLSATNNASFVQNTTTQQTANFNITGNGTLGGNLTVAGTINGTATNATNATNAAQLGGLPAANYLTTASTLGQNVTTVRGVNRQTIDATVSSYTLIPQLTQTVNVPANSALFIATDGGLQSTGTPGSDSVVDVAIFVDGAAVLQRRIFIINNPRPAMVASWALQVGQTLAAGSHTIEVRVKNGLLSGAVPAVVGGDELLNGQLTVVVVKK